MATAEEMRAELYERARAYVAEAQPGFGAEAVAQFARHGVDAMINAQITAGVDEEAALEYAMGRDIKKIVTVVMTE